MAVGISIGLELRIEDALLVPTLSRGGRVEIDEQAFFCELPDLCAVHLHSGRRIAGGNASLKNLIGVHAGAAGDGGVLPDDPRLLNGVLDHLHCVRLAARGPEMHQFEGRFIGVRRSDPDGGQQCQGTNQLALVIHFAPPCRLASS